jgi:hypothetical protein
VNPSRVGAEQRTPVADGYGATSTFQPPKSGGSRPPGNYARLTAGHTATALGVTPDSDETRRVEWVTNAGRGHEAGLVRRCRAVNAVLQTRDSGSVA